MLVDKMPRSFRWRRNRESLKEKEAGWRGKKTAMTSVLHFGTSASASRSVYILLQNLHEKERSFCCIKLLDFRVCYFSLVDLILTKSVMTVQFQHSRNRLSQTALHALVMLHGMIINLFPLLMLG